MKYSAMSMRILIATAVAAQIGACGGTPSTVGLLHNKGPLGARSGLRERMDWNRKCEIMVLASREPDKANYLQSRCR